MKQFHLTAIQTSDAGTLCFDLVVSAESEQEARAYAVEETGEEVWNDPRYATCQALGSFGVIYKFVSRR